MTVEEIRNICIDSATMYFEFLEHNDKGLQEVDVSEITSVPGNDPIYKLRLAAKLFDLDSVFFKLHHNNTLYTVDQIKIIEYDGDKNVLLVKPGESLVSTFERLHARDIKVISDLKFLVSRIKAWYELNGADVAIPDKASLLKDSVSEIEFLKGSDPSENQKQALNILFHNPFSYIWGAPGTGKTQFVLSYALLHYIRNGKKVAVLAPTNNALEQVLRGVIKMLDKASIPRTKILRLGTPSKRFAEEFPEVCEEKGVMKKMEEVNKQINIIERLLVYEKKRDGLRDAKKNLDLLFKVSGESQKVAQEEKNFQKSKEIYLNADSKVTLIEREISILEANQKFLKKKINSFRNKLSKILFKKNTKSDNALLDSEVKIKELLHQKTFLIFELRDKEKEYIDSKGNINQAKYEADKVISDIIDKFIFLESFKKIVSVLKLDNWVDIKKQLEEQIKESQKELQVDEGLFQDYQHHTVAELNNHLQKLLASRAKLSGSSTEERLQTINVMACTLDGYVGRYTDVRMRVDHIFMDEAGYSNIVKALTLFNHNVPITFLGDHMQLPPVCEINDMDIQKNLEYNNIFLWSQSAIYLEGLFQKTRDTMLLEYLNNAPLRSNEMKRSDLNQTYRFGENLAKILGRHVYSNGFGSLNKYGDTKLFYVHANKQEGLKSRISINEVMGIQNIVDQMDRDTEDFIILTPYKKQVKLIGQFLPQERNELKILTVHGSQGREWDTVILSIVDTSDKWFVDSRIPISKGLNLLNTAVSRAKRRLIIVCDSRYWKSQNGQLVTDLLSESKEIPVLL